MTWRRFQLGSPTNPGKLPHRFKWVTASTPSRLCAVVSNSDICGALATRLDVRSDVIDDAIALVWLCLVAGREGGRMKENIRRIVIGLDEAEPAVAVEKLYYPARHFCPTGTYVRDGQLAPTMAVVKRTSELRVARGWLFLGCAVPKV